MDKPARCQIVGHQRYGQTAPARTASRIAEVAAIELIRRDRTPDKLPNGTINLVGPDTLTGSGATPH